MKYPLLKAGVACALQVCAVLALAGPPPRSARPPASAPVHPTNLEQAVKQVQHQTQGHILAADSFARGQSKVYRIKVLTPQGRVKVMQLHSNPQPKPRSSKHDPDQGGH